MYFHSKVSRLNFLLTNSHVLVSDSNSISNILISACSNHPYVAFKYSKAPLDTYDVNGNSILISKINMDEVIQQLSSADRVLSIRINENKGRTKLQIRTIDNNLIKVEFIHEFLNKSLCYMDKDIVFESRVRDDDGIFVPTNFKLLEYALLNNFLNDSGISEEQFDYFDSLNFKDKVDLIETFNEIYNTNFPSVFLLSCFDEDEKYEMIKHVKVLPQNRLINQMNVKVHTFFGYMKQARII